MTGRNGAQQTRESLSRRAVLGALGAGGAVSIAGCGVLDDDDDETQTDPDAGDTVSIGLSLPQDGRWQDEGRHLQNGYLLAAQHINDGTGPLASDGDYEPPLGTIEGGILGQTIELEIQNTGSNGSGARESAETLVNEGVSMFTGGGSPEEGLSHQGVASETETVYMNGFAPTNRVGGEDCSGYGFNEMFNARMAGEALATVLEAEIGAGADLTFAQVYPDSEFGNELSGAVQDQFEAIGWTQNRRDSTRVGAGSYSGVIGDVLDTEPDLIVLDYTGLDAAIALDDLDSLLGEREAEDDVLTVVPILTWEAISNAQDPLGGVYGTVPWTAELDGPFNERFIESWDDIEAEPAVPPGISQLAYVQLYQYAAAVERAGTFDADVVVAELENHEYDVGLGATELRRCDHQASRPVPVVRGLDEAQQSPGEYTQLLDVVRAEYGCNEAPASDCGI